jgi:hypothetical protein
MKRGREGNGDKEYSKKIRTKIVERVFGRRMIRVRDKLALVRNKLERK